MCLTFHILTLWNFLTKNFEIFLGGHPHFCPSKLGVSKNEHSSTAYDPTFLCRILFYSKNGDVCKKLELNTLRFDRDMRVLSTKNQTSKFSSKFLIFPSTNEKHHKSANFQDFSKIFVLQWDQCTQDNSEARNNSSKNKFYIFKPLTRSRGW